MDVTELFEDRNSFLSWAVVTAVVGAAKKRTLPKEAYEAPRDLTISLNGVELDAVRFLNRLKEAFDQEVDKRAKELIDEHKENILDPFNEEVERITQALKELI